MLRIKYISDFVLVPPHLMQMSIWMTGILRSLFAAHCTNNKRIPVRRAYALANIDAFCMYFYNAM